ncbi:Protein fam136a [Clonorchis sinensis]|uniref:Protein fam136a n=2 Tax=Clonorchis sinensis TaxID=79923 RepID=A0A8T1MR10_CLOSI|nr:Protein fam136a [Clonorchis sinensis]
MDLDQTMERDLHRLQDQYQQTLQSAMTKLDKEFLRKMQATYFRCGLQCAENSDISVMDVQRCIERCESPLSQAQNLMQSELSSFQNRVQQCSSECANRARDGLKPEPSDEEIRKAQQKAFKCAQNCVETQLSSGLPALMERLRTQLQKLKADQLKMI